MPIGSFEANFSEILVKIQNFSFTKMFLKISSAIWWSFCLRGDGIKTSYRLLQHAQNIWTVKCNKCIPRFCVMADKDFAQRFTVDYGFPNREWLNRTGIRPWISIYIHLKQCDVIAPHTITSMVVQLSCRWSYGTVEYFHPTWNHCCNYLSMPKYGSIFVSEKLLLLSMYMYADPFTTQLIDFV